MIFMGMGQDNRFQLFRAGFDKPQIWQNHINAWHGVIRKADAKIDHQPAPLIMIKIGVHADLARPAKRQENQIILVYICHFFIYQARMASWQSPSVVKSGRICSIFEIWGANK